MSQNVVYYVFDVTNDMNKPVVRKDNMGNTYLDVTMAVQCSNGYKDSQGRQRYEHSKLITAKFTNGLVERFQQMTGKECLISGKPGLEMYWELFNADGTKFDGVPYITVEHGVDQAIDERTLKPPVLPGQTESQWCFQDAAGKTYFWKLQKRETMQVFNLQYMRIPSGGSTVSDQSETIPVKPGTIQFGAQSTETPTKEPGLDAAAPTLETTPDSPALGNDQPTPGPQIPEIPETPPTSQPDMSGAPAIKA